MLRPDTPLTAPEDTAAPLARWETIASALRDDILQGRFPPGERLPNEQTLAQRFGVHRHTLRQAVQALAHEGHLQVRHGSGTYVRELVLDYALKRRTRLTENLASIGETAKRELLSHARGPAGPWSGALKVPARSAVETLHTRVSVRGRVVGVSWAAFPCPRLAGIGASMQRLGSITASLQERGVSDYTRARSVVATRLPTPDEADALARPAVQPVLVVNYVNVDRDGVPLEAGTTLFAADAVQLVVEPEGAGA